MEPQTPLISVLMGVYNCEPTLAEAIESIKGQSYKNWEFIICDDGSRDGTAPLVQKYAKEDSRIKFISNQENLGLAASLNHCAQYARGEYLARMDGDDISEPQRFEKLVAALKQNPDAAVVSSWMSCFDESGTWGLIQTKPAPTRDDFSSGTPFCHAPCMMRHSVFKAIGGYGNESWVERVEDYNLWFRMYAAGYRGINLQEPLYRMRNDRAAMLRRNFRARRNGVIVRWKGVGLLGYPWWQRLWAVKPLLVWLLPSFIYLWIYRRRRGVQSQA